MSEVVPFTGVLMERHAADPFAARRAVKTRADGNTFAPQSVAEELGFAAAQLRKHVNHRLMSTGIPDASTEFLRGMADYLVALAHRLEAGR